VCRPLQTLTEASCHGDIAREVRNLEIDVLEAQRQQTFQLRESADVGLLLFDNKVDEHVMVDLGEALEP
jgi:hypothetical protein